MRALIALLLVCLTACGGSAEADGPIKVYIMAGQSNMFGADAVIDPVSKVKDLVGIGTQTDLDRSSMFTLGTTGPTYSWGDVRGHDGASLGQFAINGQPVKTHGPEVGFNRAMGGNIAIIKYADNYPGLEAGRSAWVKPGSRWVAWTGFVDKQLAALGKPYVIAGFVWHQGIDDGILHREQAGYAADLRQIAMDLRGKYGAAPFVLARSVNSPIAGAAYMAPIRAAQVEVGSLPGFAWIDVDDLGPYVNSHHLTAAAQLVAGQRFAAAMK